MASLKETEAKLIEECIARGEMEIGEDGQPRVTPAHCAHMIAESKKFLTCPNCGHKL